MDGSFREAVDNKWPAGMLAWYRYYKVAGLPAQEAATEAARQHFYEGNIVPAHKWTKGTNVGGLHEGRRWIEDPEALGLREVGTVERIIGRDGRRTYEYSTNEQGDSNIRGVVYRLPSGRGFLVGYETLDGSTSMGGVCFSMEVQEHNPKYCENVTENRGFQNGNYCECCRDAADEADRITSIVAQQEWEHNQSWDEANQACYRVGMQREKVQELIRDLREARKTDDVEKIERLEQEVIDEFEDFQKDVRDRNYKCDWAESEHGISFRDVNSW